MPNKENIQIVPKRRNSQTQGYRVDSRAVIPRGNLQQVNLAQKRKLFFKTKSCSKSKEIGCFVSTVNKEIRNLLQTFKNIMLHKFLIYC